MLRRSDLTRDPTMTEAPSRTITAPPSDAFHFGQNWQRYLDTAFSPERLAVAQQSLKDLIGVQSLAGSSWVDIGCGSGIFSLAAYRLGAARLTSIDIDPDAVACCTRLWEAEGRPANWRILHGSVLDPQFVAQVEPADIVYSWGVLHHTGDMWRAIENAASRVRPGGRFVIAIYNKVGGALGSETWLRIKRLYVHSPAWFQWLMTRGYFGYYVLSLLAHGRNPIRSIRSYKQGRGMSVLTDVIDWVGGYPYEYATDAEIADFCRTRFGMSMENVVRVSSLANNEFVFRAPGLAGSPTPQSAA